MTKLLKFIDKVLTKAIDWLYLKRTILRLKMQAKGIEAEGTYKYHYPTRMESIDKCLGEYGLSIAELSKTGAMHRSNGVDATMKA